MCKHIDTLEAMRTAIVTASSLEPSDELGRQILAYEALLDPMYTKGCDVCYELVWKPDHELVVRGVERDWLSRVLSIVKTYGKTPVKM